VGSYTGPPERAATQIAIYERVFTTANPLFVAGEYQTRTGSIHKVSRFMVPLSDDGVNANKVVFTRIARFSSDVEIGVDWLKGTLGRTKYVAEVFNIAELERLGLDWERDALSGDLTVKNLLRR
jgi:hypothetical protein